MSCYEWEKGEIKLPSACYAKFRRDFLAAYNQFQDEVFELARKALPLLRKGNDRGYDWGTEYWLGQQPGFVGVHSDKLYRALRLLHPKDGKYLAPKKQDLHKLPISREATVYVDEASIGFHDAGRCITWYVAENNHACETAHEHPLAQTLFRMLADVTWTRGTGGQIVGNNEYNRESDYAGGGGNFVKATYGPKSEAAVRRR